MSRPTAIVNLQEDTSTVHTINMLLYGMPGVGKTPLLGTGEGTLILDCDNGGSVSAKAAGSTADVMRVDSYGEMDDAYQYLKNDDHDYRWVWWDSLTLFQERTLIEEITMDAHMRNPNQDPWVPSKREYGVSRHRIMDVLRKFTNLPINFGVTCHVTTEPQLTEDGDEKYMYMPAVQGYLMPSKVCGYMNVIGLMQEVQVDGDQHKAVYFNSKGEWFARDRLMRLPYRMLDPTIPEVEEAIGDMSPRKAAPARAARPRKKAASAARKRG